MDNSGLVIIFPKSHPEENPHILIRGPHIYYLDHFTYSEPSMRKGRR